MYFSFEVVRSTLPCGLNLCKLVLPCLLTETDLLHVSFLSVSSLVVVAVVVPTLVVVIVLVVLLMVIVLWMKFKRQGN